MMVRWLSSWTQLCSRGGNGTLAISAATTLGPVLTVEKDRYRIPRLALLYGVLLTACLPGDPGKALFISNECDHEIWVRASESGSVSPAELKATTPTRVLPSARMEFSAFDNDTDGLVISVGATESDIGQLIPVPHSDDRTLEVRVAGPEQCG